MYQAMQELGIKEADAVIIDLNDDEATALSIIDNRSSELATWDDDLLAELLKDMPDDLFNITGFDSEDLKGILDGLNSDFNENDIQEDEEDEEDEESRTVCKLTDRFLVSPFSVFNTRQGWWQLRKKQWLDLGISSNIGRGQELTIKGQNRLLEIQGNTKTTISSGTSTFDPVLCEILYKWFTSINGLIIDPFAGGSVRGIVASKCQRIYIGVDLSETQIEENRKQATIVCDKSLPISIIDSDNASMLTKYTTKEIEQPKWIIGDSRNIDTLCANEQADFIFSCPPYADLEKYSDNPLDLSTLNYQDFISDYSKIIGKSCSLLKEDRFACFVVGEVRDKKGHYYNFVSDTIDAFKKSGLHYYNEIILITAIGTLPIRVGRSFSSTRKVGKTHQNVLVFVKGDSRKATKYCGDVMVNLINDENYEN